MNLKLVTVGLGEMAVSKDVAEVLVAYGLGSCVGVGMYDPKSHVAGLLHAVLPESNNTSTPHAKFVESGIPLLLESMLTNGASKDRLETHIVGGANMLLTDGVGPKAFRIGERNVTTARKILAHLGLPLRSEVVGGTRGRTLLLYVHNGSLTLRELGNKEVDIQGEFSCGS